MDMVKRKTWEEFRDCKLLWWINTMLHMFGWAIVFEYDGECIKDVYPSRVKFRGFDDESNTTGYKEVTKYLKNNIEDLYTESLELYVET